MKILILGHGQHGKDAFAEMINKEHGLRFTSSSLAAFDVIWPALRECKSYKAGERSKAYEERRFNRKMWKALISLYNAADLTALCRKVLEENDVYVGMRCNKEYRSSKHLFDKIYYIDASDRIKIKDHSMDIKFNPEEMELIDNNYELCELYWEVKNLCLS